MACYDVVKKVKCPEMLLISFGLFFQNMTLIIDPFRGLQWPGAAVWCFNWLEEWWLVQTSAAAAQLRSEWSIRGHYLQNEHVQRWADLKWPNMGQHNSRSEADTRPRPLSGSLWSQAPTVMMTARGKTDVCNPLVDAKWTNSEFEITR